MRVPGRLRDWTPLLILPALIYLIIIGALALVYFTA